MKPSLDSDRLEDPPVAGYTNLPADAQEQLQNEVLKNAPSQKRRYSTEISLVSDDEYARLAASSKERMRNTARRKAPRRQRGSAADGPDLSPQEYARLNRETVDMHEAKWEKNRRMQNLIKLSMRMLGFVFLAIVGVVIMLFIEKR